MKPLTLTSLNTLQTLDVDTIIDVRSPSEFAEDHLPGAINLPVLSDAQRAEVGTIYKQDSPFRARKVGGALVAQNTASHLQGQLCDHDGSWQPLIYCWRGGQRSGAFATVLDQVGWRVRLLQGGYRSYRRLVVGLLYETPLPHRLMIIEGGTGTAKTALLGHLSQAGAQVLDLEGLAAHRGSLFGAVADPQPAQKLFETRVAEVLNRLDPSRITWVEAESSKIGERTVPPSLWAAMQAARRVEITAAKDVRAAYLAEAYADLTLDKEALARNIDRLRPYHAGEVIAGWNDLARRGAWVPLARDLIARHYDPRYAKSAARSDAAIRTFQMTALDGVALAALARQLIKQIS
ncbi:MAG: tRNA 2-selenouridine(34) synthase MnmH [Pseudomonadota bacterium]